MCSELLASTQRVFEPRWNLHIPSSHRSLKWEDFLLLLLKEKVLLYSPLLQLCLHIQRVKFAYWSRVSHWDFIKMTPVKCKASGCHLWQEPRLSVPEISFTNFKARCCFSNSPKKKKPARRDHAEHHCTISCDQLCALCHHPMHRAHRAPVQAGELLQQHRLLRKKAKLPKHLLKAGELIVFIDWAGQGWCCLSTTRQCLQPGQFFDRELGLKALMDGLWSSSSGCEAAVQGIFCPWTWKKQQHWGLWRGCWLV